ncbi:MAG TPA: ABC transporter permease subunit [Acidimicrobiia bacterium]|nr:ABC transporter permease subunit [Acidimicrobiia bacterium]
MTSAPVTLQESPPSPGPIRQWLISPIGAQLTAIVVFVGLWQLLTLIAERVPGPAEVANFLYVEITGGSHGGIVTGEFWEHFAITLRRFSAGLFIGFTAGLLIGVVIGSYGMARALLNDTVLVLLTMPAFVWAFLTTMWFGISWRAPVLTVAFVAFPFVAINVAQGVRAITPDLRNMSAAFEVSRWKQFRHLILPAVAGYIFAGLRFAIIVGWNAILLSEWFSGQAGVGFRTRYWFDANRYRGFVGWVIVFIFFIVVLDRVVLNRLQTRAFRWRDPIEVEVELAQQEQVGV